MARPNHPNFFSGLSGIVLPIPKYEYPLEYQKTSRLTYYSTFFNSIEVNSSFYKIPMRATVARWASSVPDNFRFSFKLFREITHAKGLNVHDSYIRDFIQTISSSGTKKGCILVQFPPGFRNDHFPQLERLFDSIHLADPDRSWNVAVEFRFKGWYNEEVYDLVNFFKYTVVIHDMPAAATPPDYAQSDIIYIRFHGPTGNYRGSYSDDFLAEYAESIRHWLQDGKTVYVYFNNTAGDAFNNLVRLNSFVN